MRRIARPLEAMGARVELDDGHLPMTITGGALAPILWESEVASAQVKGAILLAALCAGVPATVGEPAPTRDHTERMLRALGVAVRADGATVSLEPADRLPAFDLQVPGDPSAAAFLVALATLADGGELVIRGVGLNPGRTGFLRALRRMGGDVEVTEERDEGGEPVGSLVVRPAPLRAIEVDGSDVPAMIDELPVLAALAARAAGTTVVRGAAELRVKESDRIAAVVSNLRSLGVAAEEQEDGFVITGGDAPLRGRVVAHADHRIAMAFGVLGALPGSEVELDDRGCVAVSYPAFWEDLRRVTSER
jgi:3-phosphoshikimate 1-carboxyvinyltransferase